MFAADFRAPRVFRNGRLPQPKSHLDEAFMTRRAAKPEPAANDTIFGARSKPIVWLLNAKSLENATTGQLFCFWKKH